MHLILASRVLADDTNNAGAGLGLVVFLVLLAGCILLFRSMSGRIKRLPRSFEPADAGDPAAGGGAGTRSGATGPTGLSEPTPGAPQ